MRKGGGEREGARRVLDKAVGAPWGVSGQGRWGSCGDGRGGGTGPGWSGRGMYGSGWGRRDGG